jgi:hypothetical protein
LNDEGVLVEGLTFKPSFTQSIYDNVAADLGFSGDD